MKAVQLSSAEAEDDKLDREHDALVEYQQKRRIDPAVYYANDIAESDTYLDDIAAGFEGSLKHLVFLYDQDRELFCHYFGRVRSALLKDAGKTSEHEANGIYHPVERDMSLGKSINALIAELKTIESRWKQPIN